jgi:hypothetical protein
LLNAFPLAYRRWSRGGGVLIIPSAPEGEVPAVPVAATATRFRLFRIQRSRHLPAASASRPPWESRHGGPRCSTIHGSTNSRRIAFGAEARLLRPSAANSRRHQRPGAPSAAARPALRSMFPLTPRSPSVAGDGISLTLRHGRKPINGVAGRLGPPAVRSCHMR